MAEKAEKERIQKEAEEAATAAALKATEQDTKMAALEKKVAEMQALAAPSLHSSTPYLTHATPSAPYTPSAHSAHSASLRSRSAHPPCSMCRLRPCTTCVLRRSWLRGGGGLKLFEPRSLASPGLFASHAALLPRLTRGWWGTG